MRAPRHRLVALKYPEPLIAPMQPRLIVGLDIGTSSVKAVAIEERGGKLVPRRFLKESSAGLRRGAVIEAAELSVALQRILGELKKFSKAALRNVVVSIGTAQIKVQHSRGIVAVSRADSEIYPDDVERAVRAAQAVNLGPNRAVVHSVTREYIVDGVADVGDPVGLSGSRLEVSCLVIDAFTPHIKNLVRAMELVGLEAAGPVLSPLAAARCALGKKQKDLGVALIDIGSGTTGLAVFEENKLSGVAKFPVGAGNITNDIAIGLKVPVSIAEQIKLNFGYAIAREVPARETVDLKKIYPEGYGNVSRRFVAEVIESRLAEIFEFVNNEIKLMGKTGQLAGGAVLVGGGAKMPGIAELARRELKLSTQIGIPVGDRWELDAPTLTSSFEDPEFMTTLGLVLWGTGSDEGKTASSAPKFRVKNFFRFFLP